MKLYDKYIKKVEHIKNKNRLFVHLNDGVSVKSEVIRSVVEIKYNATFGSIAHEQKELVVFVVSDKAEEAKTDILSSPSATDLIESYGASELPPAPKEITDPEPSVEQEKKTTTRRRRNTRRKTTKTTKTSE